MQEYETTRRVKHTADNMFDLVADVKAYPHFVPLCRALAVRRRDTLPDGREVLVADMTVAYKFIRETFTSRVVLDRANRQIDVTYLDGPFKELFNRWTFTEVDEKTTDVNFSIRYEFKSRTLATLMGSVFDHAFRRFATAFEERANEVYGMAA
ncbi:type II toxin-antitoxin system RatA family toxin [Acuticoccus mangrovi]|uniref:Type II toxin-antitoxin system RatA family toxin n=1 Tax=Acuticoccus mangrovi TaxID=2796142 RepID=A0A934IV13_9HYPH|nr:type II toxin-antitoxin system RatA family toxin [Acuticoccus mangrovi]MBJ3778239.1 type II toxin-antitoxin system RatA family toxin [Acuticoccus mangrovi]